VSWVSSSDEMILFFFFSNIKSLIRYTNLLDTIESLEEKLERIVEKLGDFGTWLGYSSHFVKREAAAGLLFQILAYRSGFHLIFQKFF
jgi:hypothetical protein